MAFKSLSIFVPFGGGLDYISKNLDLTCEKAFISIFGGGRWSFKQLVGFYFPVCLLDFLAMSS